MTNYMKLNYRDCKVGVIGAIRGVIGPYTYNSCNYRPEFRAIGIVQTPIRLDSVDR